MTTATENRVLAIDPGTELSAWLLYDRAAKKPIDFDIRNNDDIVVQLESRLGGKTIPLVVEMVASYGMPVGREVFETCVWIGRFLQVYPGPTHRIYRKDIKLHLCGQYRAKDANIRQELLNRFGPGKDKAIGKKASPGPLYGICRDLWSALAVAVTFTETYKAGLEGE